MKAVPFLVWFFFSLYQLKAQDAVATDSSLAINQKQNTEAVAIKPKVFSFITNLPKDYAGFYKREFKKTQINKYAAIAVSTGLLIVADKPILDGVQHFGNNINLAGNDHLEELFAVNVKINNREINLPLNIPADANSGLYFIGDGITHFGLVFGFWTYGEIAKDHRAQRTGIQIMESMLAGGIAI